MAVAFRGKKGFIRLPRDAEANGQRSGCLSISTKQLYNFYYKKIHGVFQIKEELEVIKNKIKEIELLHEKESSALTNSLLLIIALIQIPAVFLDDTQALLARAFGWAKEPVAAVLLALGILIAAFLFWRVKRRNRGAFCHSRP